MNLADIKDVSIFAEYLGSLFRIEAGPDQFVDAKLIEVEPLDTGSRAAQLPPREPFSLLFAMQANIELPQHTYRVSHDRLGELPLFLVPVGSGQMESIFN